MSGQIETSPYSIRIAPVNEPEVRGDVRIVGQARGVSRPCPLWRLILRYALGHFAVASAAPGNPIAVIDPISCVLLAQQGGGEAFSLPMLLMPLAIIAMYWLLIARPQRREMTAKAEMLKALKKNDHVITTSGIYGVVTSVRLEANEVTLRIDEASNAKLRMTLNSIGRVIGQGEETKETT